MNISHLYKITNNINGKYYIGKHNGIEQNGYWGSGLKLKYSIEKYGVENFKYDILVVGEEKYIYELEEKYVTIDLIKEDKLCMNLMAGGFGSSVITEETRKKLSKAKKGHEMYKRKSRNDKIRKALTGSKLSEERKEKIKLKALGRRHSELSKKKRSNSMSKLFWINNGKKNLRVGENNIEKYLNNGYIMGRGKIIFKEI